MTDDQARGDRGLPTVIPASHVPMQVDRAYHDRVDVPTLEAFFRRRKRSILCTAAAVFVLVVLVTLLMPRTYESNATFLVEVDATPEDGRALDLLQRIGAATTRQTEVELIQSRRVLSRVLDTLGLRVTATIAGEALSHAATRQLVELEEGAVPGRYDLRRVGDSTVVVSTSSGEWTVKADSSGAVRFAGIALRDTTPATWRSMELRVLSVSEALGAVRDRVSAGEVRREADLVQVSCTGETPAAAHDLCRAVSSAYLHLKLEMQRAEATTAASFLSEQAQKAEESLKAAEDSLARYSQRANAIALQEQASRQVQQSADLWAQREAIRTERTAIRQLLDRIEQEEPGSRKYRDLVSFPTFLTRQSQIVPRLVETLVDLETQRSTIAVRRSDEDPEIQALDDRIDEIESQLETIADGYVGSLESQEESLDQAIASTGATLSRIPQQQAVTVRLQRQVDLYADLYTFLQTRLREAELAQAVELPSVRVVDVAALPHAPSSPRTKLNLALGLFLATGLGLMVGLWREYTDTRLHERRAIEFEAGIPVLTMLPHIGRERQVLPVRKKADRAFAASAGNGKEGEVRELALEAMRTLAAELGFAAADLETGSMQAVAVTSAAQGDGKTFTACNLAIAKASQGYRVLLVDADLRGKGASRTFKVPADQTGLSDLVSGRGYHSVPTLEVSAGENARLHILPCGTGNSDPAELMGGRVFQEALEWARERFDFIVVDTPPLTLLSDAATVATLVDGVVVVVRSGKTDRGGLEYTLERLDRARAKTVGIVLNDVDVPNYYRTYAYNG